MSSIFTTVGMAVLSLATALAHAAPGEGDDDSHVDILESPAVHCVAPGGLCWTPGPGTALAGYSSPAAVAGDHAAPLPTPGFSRTLSGQQGGSAVPWTVEVNANLRRRALAGNAVFLVFDAEDHKALAKHEVMRIWQAPIPAENSLGARFTLSPEDNFRANHNYLIRVAQIIHGQEVILTEGQVRLQ